MMLDYALIRQSVDCREVVAAHLGPGRRAGKWVKFRSPWRDDRNPSLIVSASGWKDMGAPDEHGDAIDFVSRYRGVSTREAAELLGGRLDLRPVQRNFQPAQVDASAPPIGWAAAASAALAAAQAALWSAAGRRVLHYLRTERGLSDASIRALGLGYSASWTPTGWRDEGRVKYLPPGIVLPRWTASGELCALRVRTLTGSVAAALGQPDATGSGRPLDKYLSMNGSRPAAGMFGSRDIAGRDVLIVEGEFDAALAGQELPDIAVITFGSASAGAPRTAVDALRSAARVFICLDADSAGQRAASALESAFTAAGVSAAQISGPIGHKDICEAFAAGVDLRAWWQAAQRAQAAGERVHAAGVPNTWRAAFNRVGQRAAGWTYELLTDAASAGSLDPLAFPRGDVAAYLEARGLVIGSRNVHLMLRKLADLGLLGEVMNRTSTSKEDSLLLGGSPVHHLSASRREVIYNLRPIGEQRAALLTRLGKELGQDVTLAVLAPITAADLDEYVDLPDELAGLNDEVDASALDEPRRQAAGALRRWAVRLASLESAPLPADIPLDSAFNWRLAAARAMEAANTAILTRRERAELLGCSTRQVKTVMERAGYVGRSTPIVIEASAGSLGKVFAAAKQHRARAVAMVIEGRVQPFSVEELRMYPADTEVKISLQPPVEYRDTGRVRPQERPPVEASAPSAPPQERPQVEASAPSPTPPRRNRNGTRLDWLLAQLRMRLAARGWQHDADRGRLLDTNTGEIVHADDIAGMLAVLTGRQRVDPDPLLAECWALGARAVRVITAG